ncbi:hypothetical protein [Halomonas faecis]|uniref:hypothetical protein n=1 Tax=Halomonas faecis TaxID=1562110 RepID=UPI0013D7C60C|nr:hypothetical protein [Halomonas faecis]
MKGFAGRHQRLGVLSVALASASLTMTVPSMGLAAVEATDFEDPVYHDARMLPDEELAGVRGKFVNSREVLFFGVEMSTKWMTAAGETLHAQADLGIDLDGARPVTQFSTNITATTQQAYAAQQAAGAGSMPVNDAGSGNARGIVQVVQAGGDFNSANNEFWIDVGHDVDRNVATGNGVSQLTTDGGSKIDISRNASGLGMSMSMPGGDQVKQEILSKYGLRQSVQLGSDHQNIQNVTRLRVKIGQMNGNGLDMKQMLDATRALDRLR